MNEQLLYDTITKILDSQDVELKEEDFGDWWDTVQELNNAPPEWRGKVFQALDKFQRGALSRLMAMYQPEGEGPAMETEPDIPIGDGYPDLPADIQLDPDLAAAASPWLNCYIEFAEMWSPRSYPGYHTACGLWLLSTIAARRVAFHFGDRRYTNLYLILAGASTIYAKTRAARIALDVLRQTGLHWLRAPDRATPQAFISYLVGKIPDSYESLDEGVKEIIKMKLGFAAQRGWFFEEFGNGITAMTRMDGYMADFRGLLREFDDCPTKYETITKTRGTEIVQRPYLAMLANLTPADLRPVAGRGAQVWGDGFLARFSFVMPPSGELSMARFPVGERIIPDELINPLISWHHRLGLPLVNEIAEDKPGSFIKEPATLEVTAPAPVKYYKIDHDVRDAVYAYNCALLTLTAQLNNEDLISSYARLHEKSLRVAALLASLEGCENIHLRHWAKGQEIAEDWRVSLHRVYDEVVDVIRSPEADLEDRILDVIKMRGLSKISDISSYIKSHSTMQIGRVADGMVEMGLLHVTTKNWGTRVVKSYGLADLDQKAA